jgi:hypothetical protein
MRPSFCHTVLDALVVLCRLLGLLDGKAHPQPTASADCLLSLIAPQRIVKNSCDCWQGILQFVRDPSRQANGRSWVGSHTVLVLPRALVSSSGGCFRSCLSDEYVPNAAWRLPLTVQLFAGLDFDITPSRAAQRHSRAQSRPVLAGGPR